MIRPVLIFMAGFIAGGTITACAAIATVAAAAIARRTTKGAS